MTPLQKFLQTGFRVFLLITGADFVQPAAIPVQNQALDGLDVAVQEHAADQCLHRIRQD